MCQSVNGVELGSAYLTMLLQEGLRDAGLQIASCSVEPIEKGHSLGRISRIYVSYAGGEANYPHSFVLKEVKIPPEHLSVDPWRDHREFLFYNSGLCQLLPNCIYVPKLIRSMVSSESEHRWFLLEDVSRYLVSDDQWTDERVKLVASHLAIMHVRLSRSKIPQEWNRWLSKPEIAKSRTPAALKELVSGNLQRARRHPTVREVVTEKRGCLLEHLIRLTPQLDHRQSQLPQTILHNDTNLDNMGLKEEAPAQTVLFDWSMVGWGAFGAELVNLLDMHIMGGLQIRIAGNGRRRSDQHVCYSSQTGRNRH